MDNLITSDVIGILIQAVGAIVVAVIAKIGADKVREGTDAPGGKNGGGYSLGALIPWIVAGISAVVMYFLIGAGISIVQPDPAVNISTPARDQKIEVTLSDSPGSFSVSGTSERVASDPNLRLYVLIHPAEPNAAGWWIQVPATVGQDGQWDAIAWIGSAAEPPEVGHTIDIVAIAAGPGLNDGDNISDPKDVSPAAQSDTIRVEIGTLK